MSKKGSKTSRKSSILPAWRKKGKKRETLAKKRRNEISDEDSETAPVPSLFPTKGSPTVSPLKKTTKRKQTVPSRTLSVRALESDSEDEEEEEDPELLSLLQPKGHPTQLVGLNQLTRRRKVMAKASSETAVSGHSPASQHDLHSDTHSMSSQSENEQPSPDRVRPAPKPSLSKDHATATKKPAAEPVQSEEDHSESGKTGKVSRSKRRRKRLNLPPVKKSHISVAAERLPSPVKKAARKSVVFDPNITKVSPDAEAVLPPEKKRGLDQNDAPEVVSDSDTGGSSGIYDYVPSDEEDFTHEKTRLYSPKRKNALRKPLLGKGNAIRKGSSVAKGISGQGKKEREREESEREEDVDSAAVNDRMVVKRKSRKGDKDREESEKEEEVDGATKKTGKAKKRSRQGEKGREGSKSQETGANINRSPSSHHSPHIRGTPLRVPNASSDAQWFVPEDINSVLKEVMGKQQLTKPSSKARISESDDTSVTIQRRRHSRRHQRELDSTVSTSAQDEGEQVRMAESASEIEEEDLGRQSSGALSKRKYPLLSSGNKENAPSSGRTKKNSGSPKTVKRASRSRFLRPPAKRRKRHAQPKKTQASDRDVERHNALVSEKQSMAAEEGEEEEEEDEEEMKKSQNEVLTSSTEDEDPREDLAMSMGGRKYRRFLVQQRDTTSPSVRRSKRTRLAPVERWRNEEVEYDRRLSGWREKEGGGREKRRKREDEEKEGGKEGKGGRKKERGVIPSINGNSFILHPLHN